MTSHHPRILITGGHLTPAVAVMEEMQKKHPSWSIVFVGRATAIEGSRVTSEEERTVKAHGAEFIGFSAGRLQRHISVSALWSLIKIPLGFISAAAILLRTRPSVIVSFGGYVALPVVVWGFFLGIPVVTHEQTRVPGLANRIIAKLSRRVGVSFADMIDLFPKGKAVFTGLPLRRIIFHPPASGPWEIAPGDVLYITGGSTGARSLNAIVYEALPELLSRMTVVHQTGRLSYADALEIKKNLPKNIRSRYMPVAYLDAEEHAWILARARLIVGRSGANTVGEIAATGKTALFIPLPWSSGGEQEANAQWLAHLGSATVARQQTLTPKKLSSQVLSMLRDEARYKTAALKALGAVKKDGAARLLTEIETVL